MHKLFLDKLPAIYRAENKANKYKVPNKALASNFLYWRGITLLDGYNKITMVSGITAAGSGFSRFRWDQG